MLDLTHIFLVLCVALLRLLVYNEFFDDTISCRSAFISDFDAYTCGRSAQQVVLAVCRCAYAIVVIVVFSRFLDAFKHYRSFGLLYVTMISMFKDVANWFFLVLFISIGAGVAFTILLPGYSTIAQEHPGVFARPFWRSFWALVGHFEIEDIFEYYSQSDQPQGTVMIVLFFLYLFLTTVVLVNLLIAQMSSRYEAIQQEGINVWLQERILLIQEFKDDRDYLPAPLNLLRPLFYDLPISIIHRLRGHQAKSVRLQRGFKFIVEGLAAEQLNELTSELAKQYLESSSADAEKDESNILAELHERTSAMLLQMEQIKQKVDRTDSRIAERGCIEARPSPSSKRPLSPSTRRNAPTFRAGKTLLRPLLSQQAPLPKRSPPPPPTSSSMPYVQSVAAARNLNLSDCSSRYPSEEEMSV